MIRRLASVAGAVILVSAAGFLAVVRRDVLTDPVTATVFAGLVLASLLWITGSLTDSVSLGRRAVSWNVFVGAANVVLSAAVVLLTVRSAIDTGAESAWFITAAMLAGGVSLSWLGVQIVFDSHHVDLEEAPSSGRVLAVALLVAGAFGVGLLAGRVV
ncbi:hypothetical protein HYG81_09290 [Natrinema zhouii]|uniref:Uncharacterized protein n=1 Tax=Natrinema zhouii TaxID=1710539 RepID=A0A7D6H369_9EURY|nr:hypothetical protein [Natrinema zhouii]QLK24328.1 hypothetical protein HYG81_09290 [Natrinema zhouii]